MDKKEKKGGKDKGDKKAKKEKKDGKDKKSKKDKKRKDDDYLSDEFENPVAKLPVEETQAWLGSTRQGSHWFMLCRPARQKIRPWRTRTPSWSPVSCA